MSYHIALWPSFNNDILSDGSSYTFASKNILHILIFVGGSGGSARYGLLFTLGFMGDTGGQSVSMALSGFGGEERGLCEV